MNQPVVRVILIEDNPGDAVLIREMLAEMGGYELVTADRLSSGLQLLHEETFAVVILDLGLPDSSGIETLFKIQAEKPEVPVVVLTGQTDKELAAQAISQGAQDYLVKGRIDGEFLTRAIRYAVERKNIEQELRKKEAQLEAILEQLPVGVGVLDRDGRFTLSNSVMRDFVPRGILPSRDPERMERWRAVDSEGRLLSPEQWPGERALRGETVSPGIEFLYTLEDGGQLWLNESAVPFRSESGEIVGAITVEQDITGRKRVEEELQQTAERLSLAQRAGRVGVFDWNITKGVVVWTPELEDVLGVPHDQFEKKSGFFENRYEDWAKLVHPEDLPRIDALFADWLKSDREEEQWEYRVLMPGEVRWILGRGRVIRDSSGKPIRMIGTNVDITERKRAEEELQKIQRLESVGMLAGGIAHDFNNILTAILGNITLAKMFLPPEEKAVEKLNVAEQASLRARGLSQQLLTFARGGAPVKKTTSIPHLVREAVEFALRGSPVKAEIDFPPDLWPVEADESQMNQAINNLALNAVQSMPKGGTLTIAAANLSLNPGNALGLPEGEYVRIDIKDQGIGISKEEQEKIFDLYYTTKEKGSGLGLSISFSVVTRHGGTITVDSKPGKGSTFSIFLPVSKSKMAEEAEEGERGVAGVGRVLFMDDEEPVREVATELLQHLGYRVETAKDGAEAITAYRQALAAGKPFDVVITDLTVPAGMGGKETVQHLLEIHPKAKVIVSSGYANDPVMSDYAAFGFKGVIPKPYRLTDLNKTLKKVLGGKK